MSKGYYDPELDLLSDEPGPGEGTASASDHALRTAPIFTGDAFEELTHHVFPQRALYGKVVSQHTTSSSQPDEQFSPKLYINTNSPFSALVCGVQVASDSVMLRVRVSDSGYVTGLGEKPLDICILGKLLDRRWQDWHFACAAECHGVSFGDSSSFKVFTDLYLVSILIRQLEAAQSNRAKQLTCLV